MLDLTPFCQHPGYGSRAYLVKPWSLGAWTYASNGHMAIRVPRREDVPENSEAPASIETVFARADEATYVPLPPIDIPKPKYVRCTVCKGQGWGDECQTCDGTGEHTCTCGQDHECGDCDGSGLHHWRKRDEIPEAERHYCAECGGRGHADDRRDVIFTAHGLALGASLLMPVLRLPGLSGMAVPAEEPDPHYPERKLFKGPVLFRFDGGMAAILPRTYWAVREDDIVIAMEPA